MSQTEIAPPPMQIWSGVIRRRKRGLRPSATRSRTALLAGKGFIALCRTDIMKGVVQVVKKNGGENNLHYHTGMDTFWMVLKGRVRFYGPDDVVIGEFGPHEGHGDAALLAATGSRTSATTTSSCCRWPRMPMVPPTAGAPTSTLCGSGRARRTSSAPCGRCRPRIKTVHDGSARPRRLAGRESAAYSAYPWQPAGSCNIARIARRRDREQPRRRVHPRIRSRPACRGMGGSSPADAYLEHPPGSGADCLTAICSS